MIYFVRHGETDYNKEGRMQGFLDIPLNSTGEKQAYQAKENLKDIKIDKIYASPLSRAVKTAKIINENYNLEISFDDRLKELNTGEIQGKIVSSFSQEYLDYYFEHPKEFGAETIQEFCDRVESFFKEIENSSENILIVAHGGVYRAIIRYLNHIDHYKFLDIMNIKNSEVKLIK